jgi:hypothetical protein
VTSVVLRITKVRKVEGFWSNGWKISGQILLSNERWSVSATTPTTVSNVSRKIAVGRLAWREPPSRGQSRLDPIHAKRPPIVAAYIPRSQVPTPAGVCQSVGLYLARSGSSFTAEVGEA